MFKLRRQALKPSLFRSFAGRSPKPSRSWSSRLDFFLIGVSAACLGYLLKEEVRTNSFSNKIASGFQRHCETPRSDFESKVVEDGVTFYNLEGNSDEEGVVHKYWNEEASIQISQRAERELMEATFELHNMCLELVDLVIQDDELLEDFEVPEILWPVIRSSWKKKKPDLLGRFDFAWNGVDPPKLLEYNADTPSVFVESAEAQLNWQLEKHSEGYQCNLLKEAFELGIQKLAPARTKVSIEFGFCMIEDDQESKAMAEYLARLVPPEHKSAIADICRLDFQYDLGYLTDSVKVVLDGREVATFLKLYPLEWLVNEVNSPLLFAADLEEVNMIEPAWKFILGNKAILPLLWEMYPGHPNLLPAYFVNPALCSDEKEFPMGAESVEWVSKPKFGREGEDVKMSKNFASFDLFIAASDSPSLKADNQGNETLIGRPIFQQFQKLPFASRRSILTSSWVINGQPAGLCFRQDRSEVTNNNSEFLPHFVAPAVHARKWIFKTTESQETLRRDLYGEYINQDLYNEANPSITIQEDRDTIRFSPSRGGTSGGGGFYRSRSTSSRPGRSDYSSTTSKRPSYASSRPVGKSILRELRKKRQKGSLRGGSGRPQSFNSQTSPPRKPVSRMGSKGRGGFG